MTSAIFQASGKVKVANELFMMSVSCINAVRAWLLKDNLKLKGGKTEFLVVENQQQLDKVSLGLESTL